MDTNFSERELELMQMRRDAMARASGQQTQPAQQQAPVQRTNISSRTINNGPQVEIPGGNEQPSAAEPNMQQMLQNVGDAVPGMLKNVAIPAAGAGILAGLAHLLLGGKGDTTGDAKAGERRDPLMDVNRTGPLEPTLAPEPQFAPGPVAPTQPVEPKPLSPLEQEDLRLKQLKNQRLELAIQHDKEKAERAKAEYEAKQAKQAAQAKQVGGGTLTETEAKMLAASETAKISKAVIADQKLQQASNARTQVEGAVAPATVAAVENATPAAVAPIEAPQLKTGTGKPAFQGMNPEGKLHKSYSSIKDVPANMAFVPGAQYVDVLRNDLSQPTYTEQFRTKEWPSVYEQAVEEAKGINRSLGRETRAALIAKGVPKEELPKPTEGIFQKIGGKHGSKIVTVGGTVGALTAIPNLVHAAQGAEEKDVQKSFGSLVQGAGQFLGPLGAIAGDIFGISPEELETVRKGEQARKVGAGRGIAPPSAYQQ